MHLNIPDLDKFTHNLPVIIVLIAGIFHIANSVWKHIVTFLKRVLRGLRELVREFCKLWNEIIKLWHAVMAKPVPRRRKSKGVNQ